jgi:hypothetical protein
VIAILVAVYLVAAKFTKRFAIAGANKRAASG